MTVKSWWGSGTCILLLLSALACHAAPVIVVEEDVYDFGVVVEGDVVSHAFLIENQGDEDLEITEVSASCGCTATTLGDAVLEPGDVRRITAEVDTSGFGGLKISQLIRIESNDPKRPQIELAIEGTVVPEAAYLIDPVDLAGSLMILIDVRDPLVYAVGHLPGAVSLPHRDAEIWLEVLPKNVRVVLYDQDGETSTALAERMLPLGFVNVQVMIGGLDEWIRRYGDRMIITLPLVVGVVQLEE